MFFLPERDYMGRRVIFYRPGVSNPMSSTVGYDVLIFMTLAFELLLENEEDQIKGVVHVADAKGIRMSHFTVFPPSFSFRVGKNSEVSLFFSKKFFIDVGNTQKKNKPENISENTRIAS